MSGSIAGLEELLGCPLPATPLSADQARALAESPRHPVEPANDDVLAELMAAARKRRDGHWTRRITFSPKVFLPLTNLCRNFCDYCSFRRSPGQAGEWTMSPDEVIAALDRGRENGCVEALFCLGDQPEAVFRSYRQTLARWGHTSTVDYLYWAAERALERGLLPHTNAGVLSKDEMARLRPVNVSQGLMLENISARLCQKGMPHHRAPDKRPERRVAMTREAGELAIPFTSGLLLGIGETRLERIDTLLAIRDLHREYGHIQEVIVQNFRAVPDLPYARPRVPMGHGARARGFRHRVDRGPGPADPRRRDQRAGSAQSQPDGNRASARRRHQ